MDDYINKLYRYELDKLDYEETLELFQFLVDSNLAWILQGHYGRTAKDLIEAGLIKQEAITD